MLRAVFSKVSPIHWRLLARVARTFAPKFACDEKCRHLLINGFCYLKIRQVEKGNDWVVANHFIHVLQHIITKELSFVSTFYKQKKQLLSIVQRNKELFLF